MRTHWNISGHSTELILSTTSRAHRRPAAHSVGVTGRLVAAEVALIPLKVWDAQLKRRAVAAIRPSALGGAYGNAGAAVLAYPFVTCNV